MYLQKAPQGLTGALDLKVTGYQPTSFADYLLGVFDATDNYTAPSLLWTFGTGNVNAQGSGVTLVVPSGYVWRVRNVCLRVPYLAADGSCITSLQFRNNPSDPQPYIFSFQTFAPPVAVTAATCDHAYYFARPFLLPSNAEIQGQLEDASAAVRAATLLAIVEQFPA